jgi:thioester reductase-like protein
MAPKDIDELSSEKKRLLLEKLLREKIAAEAIDLEKEALIDLTVNSRSAQPSSPPASILLTGVTGFVGAFLLRELIECTSARIHCMVRAENEATGLERIRANLEKYAIWSDRYAARIDVVPGDLAKPRMNLSDERFRTLAQEVDVIYHIAATVNLAYKYQMLKPTNVGGTREMLKFACAEKTKALHYLSSYAPFDSVHNAGKTIFESDVPMHSDGLSTGYNETKWVAEKMVRNAKAQGLPVAIYRVGWVAGHTESGFWNASDFIPRLIQACTTLGKYTFLGVVTMTPVDYVVKALLYLSQRESSIGDTFHLSNGERYSTKQLFDWVKGYGYGVAEVSYAEWEQAMMNSSQEAALMPMKLFLENAKGVSLSDWFSREPVIDSAYTRQILSNGSIVAPRLNQELMNTYLDHFVASGYLDPPGGGDKPKREKGSGPGVLGSAAIGSAPERLRLRES